MTLPRKADGSWLAGALALAAVALSRWPLLGNGYGSDPDAWRTVVAASRSSEPAI